MSKPLMVAALGARGTGKSAWVAQEEAKAKASRVVVWDFMREHGAATGTLGECIRAMSARTFRVVFQPSHDAKARAREFELFCSAVYAAGKCRVLVEELAFVTKAWGGSPAWQRLTLLGRHREIWITGTSQRPAQVDKDFLGNCDVLHVGRLVAKGDAKVAAEILGVQLEEVLRMPDLAFIERRAGATEPTRGVLNFTGPKPRPAKPSAKPPKGANLPEASDVSDTPSPAPQPAAKRAFNPLEPWK